MLDRFFEAFYRRRPVTATFTGLHEHDRRLPDWSLAGLAAEADEMRSLRAGVAAARLGVAAGVVRRSRTAWTWNSPTRTSRLRWPNTTADTSSTATRRCGRARRFSECCRWSPATSRRWPTGWSPRASGSKPCRRSSSRRGRSSSGAARLEGPRQARVPGGGEAVRRNPAGLGRAEVPACRRQRGPSPRGGRHGLQGVRRLARADRRSRRCSRPSVRRCLTRRPSASRPAAICWRCC